jgi:DNA (cytosine-5)-methyltransferase 1
MDPSACKTLAVRGTYRRILNDQKSLEIYRRLFRGEITLEQARSAAKFKSAFEASNDEIHCLELGPSTRKHSNGLIQQALLAHKIQADSMWVLVGGPPCQAYSLAGRSRRRNDSAFEDDAKHFLYREYLNILAEFSPPIFVMENVKGLLSSTHDGNPIFERIIADLSKPSRNVSYAIHSLTVESTDNRLQPQDFVIRSEDYGVPQSRHRVILLGIRSDLHTTVIPTLVKRGRQTVWDAIGDLPQLRSGLSKSPDSLEAWLKVRDSAGNLFPRTGHGRQRRRLGRGSAWQEYTSIDSKSQFARWVRDEATQGFAQHQSRSHMESDLLRYWYASTFASKYGVSPKLKDFPISLLPKHANAALLNRPFEDRFRVQVRDRPATTVVSHIAKDGHYYIHPDPDQMRSLTVREAARLQTFPDSYLFMGNRTNQFVQVGNAVPPLLANQIASVVSRIIDGF